MQLNPSIRHNAIYIIKKGFQCIKRPHLHLRLDISSVILVKRNWKRPISSKSAKLGSSTRLLSETVPELEYIGISSLYLLPTYVGECLRL